MTLEFGRPKTFSQAWVRIPDRSYPEYGEKDGNPYEHVAHLKERLFELFYIWAEGNFGKLSLEQRMIPLNTDDLRLLFQVNSFYRNLDRSFTEDWSCIPGDSNNPWKDVLPYGPDDGYRWWQIMHLDPDVKLGSYRLFCIEMNSVFRLKRTEVRFDENSEFELVLATKKEIDNLKQLIKR